MFFKSEDTLKTDNRHWDIYDINNGIKFVHSSGEHEDYIEFDEIDGVNAFENNTPLSVLDIFSRMIYLTPRTKGFIYNNYYIINKVDKTTLKPKGFIIRPRHLDKDADIDNNNAQHYKESYVSVETLRATNMRDFVSILRFLKDKSIDAQLQQVLDTED